MNHIVLLNTGAKDLDHILTGKKTMLLRGSMGKKIPYKNVEVGDRLFFINNGNCNCVLSTARVSSALFSKRLTVEESNALIDQHQDKLLLNTALRRKYAGKQYLSLIEFDEVNKTESIEIDRAVFEDSLDWYSLNSLERVIVENGMH